MTCSSTSSARTHGPKRRPPRKPQDRKLSSYVKKLQGISTHEKLSFIQQFFQIEPILEDDSDIEQNLSSIVGNSANMVAACACKVIVNTSQISIPWAGVYGDGSLVPIVKELPNWEQDGNSSFWHTTSTRGAAKYQQLTHPTVPNDLSLRDWGTWRSHSGPHTAVTPLIWSTNMTYLSSNFVC